MSRQTALRAHIRQHVECTVLGAGRLAAPIASTPTNHDHPAVATRSHLDHLPPYSRTSRPSAAQFAATTPLSTERGWPLASFCSSFRISPEAPSLLCCSLCKKSSKDARRQAEVAVFVVATMLCHHGATSLRRCGTQGMVAASSTMAIGHAVASVCLIIRVQLVVRVVTLGGPDVPRRLVTRSHVRRQAAGFSGVLESFCAECNHA